MHLIPSDPNIETIVSRILNGDINLQPEFQRGEVWSYAKKQRLIDTILRNWHIPPIHLVVVKEDGSKEVLDGQQRLASIRDFVSGQVTVNGKQEPRDSFIESLDGLRYDQLPKKTKRDFDDYSIRVFSITDYEADEPGELFYRLNQPTSLTAAEQRNAFYGAVRNQIKDLVKFGSHAGIDAQLLGFSNSRMAYDDVFSRLALTLEIGSLSEKITSARITEYYRSEKPLRQRTVQEIEGSLLVFSAIKGLLERPIRFNRATLYSWLCFFIRLRLPFQNPSHPKITSIARYMEKFEAFRTNVRQGIPVDLTDTPFTGVNMDLEIPFRMASIYNDRASSRIYDVSSILFRDVITWVEFVFYIQGTSKSDFDIEGELEVAASFVPSLLKARSLEASIEKFIRDSHWGSKI